MYSQKILSVVSFSIMSLVIVGCGEKRGAEPVTQTQLTGTGGLIQGADGKSYDMICLKNSSPLGMANCEVVESQFESYNQSTKGFTYAYSDTTDTYSNATNYYYWNLLYFSETDFCKYLWGLSSCYSYFGYKPSHYAKPKYGNCWTQYLFDYSWDQVPAYCYWKWDYYTPAAQVNTRLRLTVSPIEGTNPTGNRTLVFVDGDGRILKRICQTNSTTNCTTSLVAYLTATGKYQMETAIASARTGTIVQPPVESCTALPTERRDYAADNNTILLRKGTFPCALNPPSYNNSNSAKILVENLDAWLAAP